MGLTSIILAGVLPAQTIGGGYGTLHRQQGTSASDQFGSAVASTEDLDGDGIPDLLIGAVGAASLVGQGVGGVFLLSGADGTTLHGWYGSAPQDAFGSAVATVGDLDGDTYTDIMVGAPFAGSVHEGAIYVFSGWSGALLMEIHGTDADQLFGASVAGPDDVDGDGIPDLLVGAEGADHAGVTRTGAAFVFSGADASLLHAWHGLHSGDQLGAAVSAVGDFDSDGLADVLVGARNTDPHGRTDAGTVFLYSGADGTRLRQWGGFAAGGSFGAALADAGDLDGDGTTDVLIGAPLALSEAGQAYVISGATGSMLFRWEGPHVGTRLGSSVSSAGDVDGDGTPDLLVGADFHESDAGPRSGSVSIYSGVDGSLLHMWEGHEGNDQLGTAVAVVGDRDQDGRSEVMAGAPSSAGFAGTVLLFGFEPYLGLSDDALSASAGGTVSIDLDFPEAYADHAYRVLFSGSGTGPTSFGIVIPLTVDALALATFHGNYPFSASTGLRGRLDSNGDAQADFTLPPGFASGAVGSTFFLAAVAQLPGHLPAVSSAAVTLSILP